VGGIYIIIIIIIISVAWLKIVALLHVLWQPLWNITLIKGFQRHHELDPPSYVEVGSAFLYVNRQS